MKIQDLHYNFIEYDKINLLNKNVTLRLDLNTPMNGYSIVDDNKIWQSLPSIIILLKKGVNNIIIISHIGRPKSRNKMNSIIHQARHILHLLSKKNDSVINKYISKEPIIYDKIPTYDDIKRYQHKILFIENIRFFSGETNNDINLAKKLSKLTNIYINDAFGCIHRKHSSIDAIKSFTEYYYGLLIKSEINSILSLLNDSYQNITMIFGGKKPETKIKLIKKFTDYSKNILICGALGYSFMYIRNIEVGKSILLKDYFDDIVSIFKKAELNNVNLHLPFDHITYNKDNNMIKTKDIIPPSDLALDIGKKTINHIKSLLKKSSLIIWNGPLGYIEDDKYKNGTVEIMKYIYDNNIKCIIGGGDLLSIKKDIISYNDLLHNTNNNIYFSTGGGSLQYIISIILNNLLY